MTTVDNLPQSSLPSFAGCQRPLCRQYVDYEEAQGSASVWGPLQAKDQAGVTLRELMLALAINHSVILETVDGQEALSASSPDEQAFVAGAEYFGFDFVSRDPQRAIITVRDRINDCVHEVQLLHVFPYESSRKRMSIIARLPPALVDSIGGGEEVRLYCKGADSVVLNLLKTGSPGSSEAELKELNAHLYDMAAIALRTLIWAKKEMVHAKAWLDEYYAATNNPAEVQKLKEGEPNEIIRLQQAAEKGLTLQGATALEDKLQDGVPEVLQDLRSAAVKIWMLTGDKVGTAKNIARACNILPSEANILEVTTETHPVLGDLAIADLIKLQDKLAEVRAEEAARGAKGGCARLHEGKEWLWKRFSRRRRVTFDESGLPQLTSNVISDEISGGSSMGSTSAYSGSYLGAPVEKTKKRMELDQMTVQLDRKHHGLSKVRADIVARQAALLSVLEEGGDASNMCLVIDEKAIDYLGAVCTEVLSAVGAASRAVVACRARKDQKAALLELIKTGSPGSCCLAIGDGANDVAMIKAGHIGVGIIGKEGMQAVNNSDFAIGQFRFLRSLLFVHGRANHRRLATFTYYMFYINVVLVVILAAYSIFAALSSGWTYLLPVFINLYAFYPAVPLIAFGWYDTDLSKASSAYTPQLYTASMRRIYYTHKKFAAWMFESLFIGVLIAVVPLASVGGGLGHTSISPNNADGSVWQLSFLGFHLVMISILLRLATEVHSWSSVTIGGFAFAIFLCILSVVIFSYAPIDPALKAGSGSWYYWLSLTNYLYGKAGFWLTMLLVVFVGILPRIFRKAWHVIGTPSAARHAKRLLQEEEQHDHQDVWAAQQTERKNLLSHIRRAKMELSVPKVFGGTSAFGSPLDRMSYAKQHVAAAKGRMSTVFRQSRTTIQNTFSEHTSSVHALWSSMGFFVAPDSRDSAASRFRNQYKAAHKDANGASKTMGYVETLSEMDSWYDDEDEEGEDEDADEAKGGG